MTSIIQISEKLQSCNLLELDIMKGYLEGWRAGIKRSIETPPIGASKAENLLYELLSLLIKNLEIRIRELKKK